MVDWLPTLLNRFVTKFDGLLHTVDWLPTLLNRFVTNCYGFLNIVDRLPTLLNRFGTKFVGLLYMLERHQTIVNQVCYEVFFYSLQDKEGGLSILIQKAGQHAVDVLDSML